MPESMQSCTYMQTTLSRSVIEAALESLESRKAQIEADIAAARAMLGKRKPGRPARGDANHDVSTEQPRKRRRLSADARKRIAEGQRKRWAEVRAAKEPTASSTKKTKQRAKRATASQ